MNELQRLCDKVPSFPSNIAMDVIKQELGADWREIYADLTPEPIAGMYVCMGPFVLALHGHSAYQ